MIFFARRIVMGLAFTFTRRKELQILLLGLISMTKLGLILSI